MIPDQLDVKMIKLKNIKTKNKKQELTYDSE
jgi:hypothetical protein